MENYNQFILLIKDWARDAYNWLKNFLKIVWGYIQSYWPKIKELVKEWLSEYLEVIILDGRESSGRHFLEALKEERPSELTDADLDGVVTLSITENNSIAKVADITATTQQEDQYDNMVHQHNGILRIKG